MKKSSVKKNKLSAQITLETAIIIPVIIMMTVMFIYMAFYIHDVVTVKSVIYRAMAERSKKSDEILLEDIKKEIKKTGFFVIRPMISCNNQNEKYIIKFFIKGKGNINKINQIINKNNQQEIIIEKKLQTDIMYMVRVMCDEIKKRKE